MRTLLHTKALVNRDTVGATQAGVIDQIIGSTPVLDRMGDIIEQEGWDLKAYKDNPVILWGHNMDEDKAPIAKALKVWIEGKGKDAKLMFKVQFDLADTFAASIYRKIKEGFINTVSVGFIPTEYEELEPGNFWGGLRYTAQQLLELSFVPVPANPEALVGLRSFAKKDKRFTPITEEKLFRPLVDKKTLSEIFNKPIEELEAAVTSKKTKAEDINVDPNSAPDEEGNTTGNTGGGGDDDNIENKPDGDYTKSTNLGDLTVKQVKAEMTAAMAYCEMPGGTKGKAASDQNANPTDPYHNLPGEADDVSMPPDDMMMKDMTAAHHRGMLQDVFGDWMSNLQTTSNEGDNSEDNVNNYTFEEGESKAETLRKAKGLVAVIEKAGRVLSGKNENKIKNAIQLLNEVIAELQKEEAEEEAENEGKEQEVTETKGVIGYSNHGHAPESESWDGPGEVAKATVQDLKIMCAWYDSSKPEDKTSYKLPHHKADGDHVAVWRGVAAAMAALLGARGGLDVPEGDRKGIYNHLKKHYAEFEKEAPDFKMVEDQVLAGFDEELFALMLEREEKHITRLIKKVLENQKEDKKVKIQTNVNVAPELDAAALEVKVLKVFESALIKVSSTNSKGGEK